MRNHAKPVLVRWAIAAAFVAGAAVVMGGAALAQGDADAVDAQVVTAIQHAGFAADEAEHAGAVRHLGHVLNCLAGPDGEGFDGSWGHPCGSQGTGILVDLAAHAAADDLLVLARGAHALALAGIAEPGLGAVSVAAQGVRALLSMLLELLG